MSVRHTISKITLAAFGLALCVTASQAQSDVKAEVNFLNGSKDFKALLKAEPTLSADRTLLLPDANGTLMLNANTGIGGTGMLYGVTGAQNTALVSTYLFNVQYVAGAGAATGALITSASTGASAMGLDVVATAGGGTATALRLASTGGTTNYALDVASGGIRIQSTLPTTTTGTDGLVLEGGIVKTRTITTVDAGTVNNTTLYWNGTKWTENTNVLAPSTGDMTLNSATIKATTNQLVLGTTTTTTISATAPAASRTYTLPDVGANASFVMTEGTQTINGNKTLSGTTSLTGVATAKAGVAIRFENPAGTFSTGFKAGAQTADVTYTLPTATATANQILRANSTTPTNLEWATITTVDAGTVNNTTLRWDNTASKWVENTNVLSTSTGDVTLNTLAAQATTNQLVLGTTNTTTISATAPAASAVYTIPDVGTTASFVMTAGAQTIAGAKTLSSALTITPTSNQLVLGTTNTTTISATAPAASRTYTLPDVGANASFVMTEGTQTINGDKTLSGATSLTGVATAKAGNAIRFENTGGTAYTGFNAAAGQASNISYTLPAVAATADQVLRANATTPTNLEWATITTVDAGTVNNTTLRWDNTASKWVENTNVLSTSTGDVTLNTLTAKATTNQLVLGTTNTTTISATAPASSATYTIPDVGATASFVMTAGAQTIAGAKTLSSALTITPTSNQLVLGTTNTTTINATAPAASATYTIPDVGASASFVMTAGTQTVAGDKTLSGSTTLSGATSISGAATIKNTTVMEPTSPTDIDGATGGTITVGATFVKQTVTVNSSGSTKNVTLPAGTADGQILCLRLNVTNNTGTGKISIRNSNTSTIETINTIDTKRFYQLMYSTADSQWMILSSQVIN